MSKTNSEVQKTVEQMDSTAAVNEPAAELNDSADANVIEVETAGSGEPIIEPAPLKYRVTYPHGLNLRTGPGKAYPALRVLPCGTELESTGTSVETFGSFWLPVEGGYVNSAYLTLADAEG